MSMNVMLVASDAALAEMLRAQGMRVTSAGSPALAELARTGSRAPELLVVDHRGGGPLPESLSAIRRQHPLTGMLVVLSTLDGARVLEAMRAGVSECLAHPVARGRNCAPPIGRIQAARPAAKKGEVYAFIGAKGGVGATTRGGERRRDAGQGGSGRHHAGRPAHDLRRRRRVPGRRAAVLHRRRVRQHAPDGRRRAQGPGDRLAVGRPAAGLVRAARGGDSGRGADALADRAGRHPVLAPRARRAAHEPGRPRRAGGRRHDRPGDQPGAVHGQKRGPAVVGPAATIRARPRPADRQPLRRARGDRASATWSG